ncbi:MAG: hypothetical protein RMH75_04830 [Archaeoglobaceae archaeon]|nr:hypothetical protein [Archaeoglobaceae archaeon]MDW7989971.1 hypothetical protein [Archaeoglobaceae archaeon]
MEKTIATCLLGLILLISPASAWMFGLSGPVAFGINKNIDIPKNMINETNWQNIRDEMVQSIEKRISELKKLQNNILSANSHEDLENAIEQHKIEEMKQRMILMIEKLREMGDSENATKLEELKDSIEKAKSLDELREIKKEIKEFMKSKKPKLTKSKVVSEVPSIV